MKLPFIQEEKQKQVMEIAVTDIVKNPYQPRVDFNKEEIAELAASIKNHGVIQPIMVRSRGEKYELIVGERRLRACRRLGLKKIPAIVKDINEREMAEIALVENIQRSDLNYLEEANAYQKLIKEFSLTQQELAEKIGKGQSTIANKLRLLSLPEEITQLINPEIISERHARALLKLKTKDEQLKVVHKILKKKLTVKETEKLIEKISGGKKKKRKLITVYKDLRIFTNTLKKTVTEMRKAGLAVELEETEKEGYLEYTIRLPKNK
ncbi:MAG TPA: nucleoid occlusion protein [Halanaerobiales bacterium]|nr:nucleoid occlusion protein [Halanaerobiales bacterium]